MTLDYPAYHWCVLCLAGGGGNDAGDMFNRVGFFLWWGRREGKQPPPPGTSPQATTEEWKKEEAMATSRTGTARWKTLRKKELAAAFERGDMRCPICFVAYDWHRSKQPNSPELDHVTAHAEGGKDVAENVRVICRQCNQRLGGKLGGKRSQARKTIRIAEPIRPKTTLIL